MILIDVICIEFKRKSNMTFVFLLLNWPQVLTIFMTDLLYSISVYEYYAIGSSSDVYLLGKLCGYEVQMDIYNIYFLNEDSPDCKPREKDICIE